MTTTTITINETTCDICSKKIFSPFTGEKYILNFNPIMELVVKIELYLEDLGDEERQTRKIGDLCTNCFKREMLHLLK